VNKELLDDFFNVVGSNTVRKNPIKYIYKTGDYCIAVRVAEYEVKCSTPAPAPSFEHFRPFQKFRLLNTVFLNLLGLRHLREGKYKL